jgi:hypothetical protein
MSLTVLPRGPESKLARKAVATDARRRASLGCGAARISPTRLRIADGTRSSLVALMSSPVVRSSWQRSHPRAERRRCHHALTLPAARYAARNGDCRRRVRDHGASLCVDPPQAVRPPRARNLRGNAASDESSPAARSGPGSSLRSATQRSKSSTTATFSTGWGRPRLSTSHHAHDVTAVPEGFVVLARSEL